MTTFNYRTAREALAHVWDESWEQDPATQAAAILAQGGWANGELICDETERPALEWWALHGWGGAVHSREAWDRDLARIRAAGREVLEGGEVQA